MNGLTTIGTQLKFVPMHEFLFHMQSGWSVVEKSGNWKDGEVLMFRGPIKQKDRYIKHEEPMVKEATG